MSSRSATNRHPATGDPRPKRTRDALRQALLRLLEQQSLEAVTIRKICEQAGVGYTSFFRYFPSKEALLEDIAAAEIRRLIELSLPIALSDDIHEASVALCTYVDEHRSLWYSLLTGGAADAIRAEMLKLSKAVTASFERTNTWPPADLANLLVVSSTVELLGWWLQQDEPLGIAEVAKLYTQLIVSPVTHPNKSNRR